MAARKAKKRRKAGSRRGRRNGGGFLQKVLVGLSGVALVLCAASITQGFFFRSLSHGGIDGQFRIEVLNGTGKVGLAHAVKRVLHRKEIDVFEVGNAPSFDYEESVLIARRKDADVERLGNILGCRNVVSQVRDGTLVDATLILGADFRDLNLDWELETDLLE